MYILALSGKEEEGAYALTDPDGVQVLYLFEEEEDAIRYAFLLEAEDFPPLTPVEVDSDSAIKTCERYNYNYAVITPDDLIIPPFDNEDDDGN